MYRYEASIINVYFTIICVDVIDYSWMMNGGRINTCTVTVLKLIKRMEKILKNSHYSDKLLHTYMYIVYCYKNDSKMLMSYDKLDHMHCYSILLTMVIYIY